ncbi:MULTISPECIES: hypothetical protein [unclassified Pseudomonas]|uniref:DUF6896 domain-containing protein n=1 Tax=unclassified Pseudomonas TaxID=196821 RepID=UPI000A1DD1E0|nr:MULTISPECIES: hypothetical protein [unclassified Pseudomonas]
MTDKDFSSLIASFLESVESSLKLLEDKFGSRELQKLCRQNKIAQRGEITDTISYQLHGNGCMVEHPDYCIDFDFAPDERTDGFDAWRLYNYACEFPEKYASYTNLRTIETILKEYEEQKIIQKIENSTSNLYFLQSNNAVTTTTPTST